MGRLSTVAVAWEVGVPEEGVVVTRSVPENSDLYHSKPVYKRLANQLLMQQY
jgi:hypothetical protein